MTPEQQQLAQLQQQLYAVQAENEQLRQQLTALAQQQQARADRRQQVIRGGGRLLIPLLDRQKVVRSFGKLAQTVGGFSGPREQWPTRDDVQGDARLFLESLVRFAVRRRMLLMLLALLGAVIPMIQIWLVVQQNQIIENQNELVREQKDLSEVQVYDVVARSMTEGDRNAKLMTGALLSRVEPEFLDGVVEEAFDPDLAGRYRSSAVGAARSRLEDAAFRGHLARAAVRSIHRRVRAAAAAGDDAPAERLEALADQALPHLRLIVEDAQGRVPEVLRLGKARGEGGSVDEALDEEVEGYLIRVGEAVRLLARLARATGRSEALAEGLRPLLRRVDWGGLAGNRFQKAHALTLELLLLDLAVEPAPDAGLEADPDAASLTREDGRAKGLEALRALLGDEGIDWAALG
ncbi:MAG: hypothetical protein KDK70_41665, partial [Myxococcales bacterium]|nr:hypothetical protein [Myxococcales bacterium]